MYIVVISELPFGVYGKRDRFMSSRIDRNYNGDCSVHECFKVLKDDPSAVLVDVRTKAEWTYVGIPVLSDMGKEPCFIEWQTYPDMTLNEGFVNTLSTELQRRGASVNTPIFFLCRSGVRSAAAAIALANAGYVQCHNVTGGFEGPLNESGHRATQEGWKNTGLPWRQI